MWWNLGWSVYLLFICFSKFFQSWSAFICAHTLSCAPETQHKHALLPQHNICDKQSPQMRYDWLVHFGLPHLSQRHWLSVSSLPCTLTVAQWLRFRRFFEVWLCSVNTTFFVSQSFVLASHVVHVGSFCCAPSPKHFKTLLLIRNLIWIKSYTPGNLRKRTAANASLWHLPGMIENTCRAHALSLQSQENITW